MGVNLSVGIVLCRMGTAFVPGGVVLFPVFSRSFSLEQLLDCSSLRGREEGKTLEILFFFFLIQLLVLFFSFSCVLTPYHCLKVLDKLPCKVVKLWLVISTKLSV